MRYVCVAACAWVAVSSPTRARDGVSFDEDGLTLAAANGNIEVTLGGRLHLDAARFEVGDAEDTETGVRRARLELRGKVAKVIRFRIERELANGGGWRNVWASVEPVEDLRIRAGNMIVPFSMEELQSSDGTALMERSLLTGIAPGFGLGAMASYSKRNFTVSAGYFGQPLSGDEERRSERGAGAAARVTFAPIMRRRTFAHVALAAERRDMNPEEQLRFSVKPGTNLAPTLLKTGRFSATELRSIGAEAAYSVGSFLIQTQYARVQVQRELLSDVTFDGWYAQASYVLTGEEYDYSRATGVVSGVHLPRKAHAIEITGRVSSLDLRDADVRGGNARSYTVGMNYYLRRNVRLMVNYQHSSVEDRGGTRSDLHADVLAGRFQIGF